MEKINKDTRRDIDKAKKELEKRRDAAARKAIEKEFAKYPNIFKKVK